MSLHYISNVNGKTTGVYIPISEWNELKSKFKLDVEENIEIPEWQINEINRRIIEYKANPDIAIDFEMALDEISKGL